MDMETINTVLLYATAVVTAASVIVTGIAKITDITPSTTDDEVVGKAKRVLSKLQTVLGTIALDSGSTAKKAVKKAK